MAEKMLKFVDLPSRMPDKRAAETRRADFGEIYEEFSADEAAAQSSRCEQCGIPFCQVHCPVSNNIPDWLMLTANGRLEEAYEVSQATNNFPEICGRTCPQDRLCEGSCVLEQSTHGTVTIGSVEKYITDTAWEKGWVKPVKPAQEREETVGIIGGGPGGLAAAEELRKQGYQVTVYDRYDRMGGLMIYGIPNFKLEKYVVERRVDLLAEAGVKFRCEFEVGRNATLEELRDRHDAILIATGVYKARDIKAPGVGLGNIFPALDFLIASNRKGLGDKVPEFDNGALDAAGKRVVVIGGGMTAVDAAVQSKLLGALNVSLVYRRGRDRMNASVFEQDLAASKGVRIITNATPVAIHGNGAVREVEFEYTDDTLAPTGERFRLPADQLFKAIGQALDAEGLPELDGRKIAVTGAGRTSVDRVWAGGDCAAGGDDLTVTAVAEGRDAAEDIHASLVS